MCGKLQLKTLEEPLHVKDLRGSAQVKIWKLNSFDCHNRVDYTKQRIKTKKKT